MLIHALEDPAVRPAVDAEPVLHAFIVLALIRVSLRVLPHSLSFHVARLKIALIGALVLLPDVPASSVVLPSAILSLIGVSIGEQLEAFAFLKPIGKVSVVPALAGVEFASAIVKIIFPETFVLLPGYDLDHNSKTMLCIFFEVPFVDISIGNEHNPFPFFF